MIAKIILDPQKLNIAMANACMNPYDLCEKANIQYSSFQRLTRNQNVKPKTAGKIAKALDVRVEDLI